VLERGDDMTWLSLRNVDTVHLLAVDQLNTYDVLLADDVVFTKGAYDAFVSGAPTGKSVKAVASSSETDDTGTSTGTPTDAEEEGEK
jgi:large subunit ribosomal protein L4